MAFKWLCAGIGPKSICHFHHTHTDWPGLHWTTLVFMTIDDIIGHAGSTTDWCCSCTADTHTLGRGNKAHQSGLSQTSALSSHASILLFWDENIWTDHWDISSCVQTGRISAGAPLFALIPKDEGAVMFLAVSVCTLVCCVSNKSLKPVDIRPDSGSPCRFWVCYV